MISKALTGMYYQRELRIVHTLRKSIVVREDKDK